MSDISLTSGMRANLLSLQSSVSLLDRTQERLSTGKKVNSALDNPVNYFTALGHTSRANDLLAFKDGISEAIQTIKAADSAISAITKLINSAKATAEAAKSVVNDEGDSTKQTITFAAGMAKGDTIVVDGTTFTAVTSITSVSDNDFYVGGTAEQAASSFAAAMKLTGVAGFEVTDNGNGTVAVGTDDDTAMIAADIVVTSGGITESALATKSADFLAKQTQYTSLLSQIDDMQADAFYKGKNLLSLGDDMTVKFGNDHTLTVAAFDGTSAGLGVTNASTTWTNETTIDASITQLEDALTKLRTESSKLSSNLAVVNARDEWISSIANILQTGADKLTLADTNEEGANMLMLQTRQSLSTSALSLSAQAAQSVLQLFR